MTTRDYIIKNGELACVGVDEPSAAIAGTVPRYAVTIILPEEVANGIRYLIKEVAEAEFGACTKGVRGLDKVKFDDGAKVYKLIAVSSEKPKITGVLTPYSKGLKLNLIKQADVKIEIWPYANHYGKGVGIELKELIFNPQPQPTGEQKCP